MLIALTRQQAELVLDQVIDKPALGDHVLRVAVRAGVKVEDLGVVRHVLHDVSHCRLLREPAANHRCGDCNRTS